MNAYLNKRNERARWRRFIRRLRARGQHEMRSWLWDLQMLGAMDRKNGGVGVPDIGGGLRISRSQRLTATAEKSHWAAFKRKAEREGEPF